MATEYLFVYGTLRRDCRAGMSHLLTGACEFCAFGSLQGRLYEVAGYPALILSRDPREQVRGDIFSMECGADLLRRLDHYEGCGAGFMEPQEYVRKQLPVRRVDGLEVLAWVYLYNRSEVGLEYIPSGDYLQFLRGKNDHHPTTLSE